jgi:hypothetical protein
MSKIIKHKRSSTAGNRPDQSQIEIGELAINFADRTIYTKNTSNVVTSIGQDIWRSASAPDSAREGDIWYNTTDGSYSFWDGAGPSWKTLDSSVEDVVSSSSSISDRLDSDHGWANTYFDQINSRLDSEHAYAATTGIDIRRDASSPSNAVEGDIWYDTTDGKYNLWNGAGPVWKSLDSTIDSAISASGGGSSGGSGFELVETLATTYGSPVTSFEFALDATTYRAYRIVVDVGSTNDTNYLAMRVGYGVMGAGGGYVGAQVGGSDYQMNGFNGRGNTGGYWQTDTGRWMLTGNGSNHQNGFQNGCNFEILLSSIRAYQGASSANWYKPVVRWAGQASTSSKDALYYSGGGVCNVNQDLTMMTIYSENKQMEGVVTLEGMRR